MSDTNFDHYIIVDFENTQKIDLTQIANKSIFVTLIIGPQQKQLPLQLVKILLSVSSQVEIIETNITGKNAVDFILTYHLSQKISLAPQKSFYIVSKDKGYDALVTHLKIEKINIQRCDSWLYLSLWKPHQNTGVIEKSEQYLNTLINKIKSTAKNPPKTIKTLTNTANTLFNHQLPSEHITQLISQLQEDNLIVVNPNNSINYNMEKLKTTNLA